MPNRQLKTTERKQKKQREINHGISLVDYVTKINKGEITNHELIDVDMRKLAVSHEDVKIELDHKHFQIKQLKKNGHLTHYGK